MPSPKRPAPAAPPPRRAEPQVSLPPRPAAPRQTFGDIQAAKIAAQKNMAPGTGGRGTQQEYAARMQQGMIPPGGSLPPMGPPGSRQTGPTSRPVPPAMVDAVRASNAGRPLPPATSKLNMSGMGMKKGGSVGSASKRADGCAIRGKTRA